MEIPEWQTFLDCKLEFMYKRPELLSQFKSLKTNYERVEFFEQNLYFSKLIDRHLDNLKLSNKIDERKQLDISESFRKKGNEYYTKKQNQNAFKFYTLALQYAPNDSNKKSLYLAYSNRSAVFFDLGMFESSLRDLNSVKKVIFDILEKLDKMDSVELSNLLIKLINREINCLIKLNQVENLKNISDSEFFSILKNPVFANSDVESKTYLALKLANNFVKNFQQIEPIREKIEDELFQNFINDCVNIEFNKTKGRHCLTDRKIKAGEVLFKEKAYCAILLPELSSKMCDLCLKSLYDHQNDCFFYLNIQPCLDCSSVLYCSEDCRNRSQDSHNENDMFHKFECKILQKLLHNLGIAHLAFRILNSTSQKLIIKYSEIQKSSSYETNIMTIDYKNDNYEENYKQVFYLLTHENSTHVDDLIKYSLTSLLLGKHYASVIKNDSNLYVCLISSLILRHLLQSICNAHAITELKDDSKISKSTFNRNQIRCATAIYPRVSLLNHSCNSNVVSTFKENSSIIVVKASRDINKNDEIFNSYGPHYIKMTHSERKHALAEQYHFKCDCKECLDQERIFFKSTKTGLRCLECGSDQIWSNNEGQKAKLIQVKCLKCKKNLDFGSWVYKFNYLNEFLCQFDPEALDENSNLKAILQLESMLKEFSKYLMINKELEVEPLIELDGNMRIFYLDFSKLIDLLARLYCNSKNMKICCELLEKNIKLLDFIYETKTYKINIEIGHELFKLAELQCTIDRFENAYKNINRAISIAECVYAKQSVVLKEFYELKKNIKTLLELNNY